MEAPQIRTTPPQSDASIAPSRFYLPELDLIRLLAFGLVFLSHAVPGEPEFYRQAHIPDTLARLCVSVAAGGAFGVDLFFALSAFLITTLLLRERQSTGVIDVPSFYLRRILRIWPLYFTFLLIVVPLTRRVLPDDDLPTKDVIAFALLAGNWAYVLWGYTHSIVGPLWSVSVEEQFYLAWPLLLRRAAPHLFGVLVVLWLIAAATRTVLVMTGAVHPQLWCNTLAHLDPIVCGGLLAVLAGKRRIAPPTWLRVLLLCCGIGVFALAARFGDLVGPRSLITYPVVSLAACALIVASLHPQTDLTRRAALGPLLHLGKVSYGLYVFHLLFITLLGVTAVHTPARRVTLIGVALLCSVVVAVVSYRVLEWPFLALKRRFTHVPSRPL
jgi:peptidoglycan/LPS O-acetylase OafA/YrhL